MDAYGRVAELMNNEKIKSFIEQFIQEMVIYRSAIKEVSTKLEILNDEFQAKKARNPIDHIKSRVKTPESIIEKIGRRGFDLNAESIRNSMYDIAGIRVVCQFIDDIYLIANMLKSQDDVTVILEKDYIKNPKPNGYRSLHIVVEIPVFFSDKTIPVKVEIQIRTIAMDLWASLEHNLFYKVKKDVPEGIEEELKQCADVIAATDIKMQNIHKIIERSPDNEGRIVRPL